MSTPNPYGPPSGPPGQPPGPPKPPSANAAPGTPLDFGESFTFFFQDPNWISKLLLGSLFSILAIFVVGSIFIAGYALRVLKRSARGEAYPLPEWDDLGGIFMDGLYASGAYLAHIMPVMIIMWVLILPMALLGESGDEPPAALFLVFPLMLFIMLAIFAVVLYFPAALCRFAVEGRFGAAFEIEKNWAFIRRNVSNYLLAVVVVLAANFVSQLGILLLCIGILPATFWSVCAGAHAFGQVVRRDPGTATVAPPSPPPAPAVSG